MANRFLGEATAKLDGKVYTLRCDFNAMCVFEDLTGKDALATFASFESGGVGVSDMRSMVLAFLSCHHPDATVQTAGDLLSQDTSVLTDVLTAAMPDAAEVGDTGNAPKSKAVSGT